MDVYMTQHLGFSLKVYPEPFDIFTQMMTVNVPGV